jgi:hypothetical protein
MGGVLPTHPQRVLGIGGTAGMVHPSTGFMVSRMLGVAPTIADGIIDQLARASDKAADGGKTGYRLVRLAFCWLKVFERGCGVSGSSRGC